MIGMERAVRAKRKEGYKKLIKTQKYNILANRHVFSLLEPFRIKDLQKSRGILQIFMIRISISQFLTQGPYQTLNNLVHLLN